MKFIASLVLILFCAFTAAVESQEPRMKPVDAIRQLMEELDQATQAYWMPPGIPDDEGPCRAFWKLSQYHQLQARVKEMKIQDSELKETLRQRVISEAEKTKALFDAKAANGELLGCGGRELSDDFLRMVVRDSLPKPISARLERNK